MDEIKVQLSENAVQWFGQNYRYTEWDADEFARDHDWSGFDFVTGSDGEPLVVPGEYVFGHLCSHLLEASNAEAAATIMEEAAPGTASEFHGVLAYDYADGAAREAAERIGAFLAGYPVLNDEDVDQRERDAAISALIDCYDVPEEIAGDVAAALSDDGQSLCTDCSSWDLDRIREHLGYRECAECDGWINTSRDQPLHYDCAEFYEEADCECVSLLVDTHRHNGVVTTWADVRETLRGCEHCYSQVLPDAKNRLTHPVSREPYSFDCEGHGMLYAVAIDAQHARSGKPRRGFLVYAATGEVRGFADDRYRGAAALWAVEKATGETVRELCSLRVTPAEYREAMRQPVQF